MRYKFHFGRVPKGRRTKLAASSLAVVCAAGLAFAISASAQSGSPAQISFLTWGSATGPSNQLPAFTEFQKLFPSAAAGDSINVELGGATDADMISKLRLILSSHGQVPDIVQMNYDEVPEFARAGDLVNLKPYIKQYLSQMTPSAKTLMSYDGTYVAIPNEVKEKLWFYRKDMFKKAGINVNDIKTQAEFIAAGKKLQLKYPDSYMWNLAASQQNYILGEIDSGNGTQPLFNRSTKKWDVAHNPGLIKAFEAEQQLRASGVVDTQFDDFTPQWQAALANGTLASVPIAEWFTYFLPGYAPKLKGEWGVTTWPDIGGAANGAGSEAGGSVFVIFKGAQHVAQAAQFLSDVYMSKTGDLALTEADNEVPNNTAAQNAPAELHNKYFGPTLIKAFRAAAKTYKIFPYDPAAETEITILNTALATFLDSGKTNPVSALQTAQQQMQSQIGDPWNT